MTSANKRIGVVELYLLLSNPQPLHPRHLQQIYEGCSRTSAQTKKRMIQDHYCRTKGKVCESGYVTREMLLAFEGWDWEEIRKEALAIMAITAQKDTTQKTVFA